ncbi:hypothetical protein CGRA01v4_12596 [Colletotrichum graminicola]|nr:hypothetical protein CGRA01v4_12596 [Colletotrichum graminicola]
MPCLDDSAARLNIPLLTPVTASQQPASSSPRKAALSLRNLHLSRRPSSFLSHPPSGRPNACYSLCV